MNRSLKITLAVLAGLLAVLMVFSFAACAASSEEAPSAPAPEEPAIAEEPAPSEDPKPTEELRRLRKRPLGFSRPSPRPIWTETTPTRQSSRTTSLRS